MKFKTKNQIENEKIQSVIRANSIPKKSTEDEFKVACNEFKNVCKSVKDFFGLEDFFGSFQECRELVKNPKYVDGDITVIKLHLALETSVNTAVFEGNELNFSGSDWWYRCWEYDGFTREFLKDYLKKFESSEISCDNL